MKKLIMLSVFLAVTTISNQSSASLINTTAGVHKTLDSEEYFGYVIAGNEVINLFGDPDTGVVTYASISGGSTPLYVTGLLNVVVRAGIARGKVFAEDDNGVQYILVINNQPIQF